MKTLKTLLFLKAIVLSAIVSISAVAHDYVLLAENFIVKKGEKLAVHLFVAYGFNIVEEKPFQREKTTSLNLTSENGTKNLLPKSKEGSLPFLDTEVDFNGLGLIDTKRGEAFISLENNKFKEYLKEEHIHNIKINENKKEQTERYTRYIKSLVQSNKKPNDQLYSKVIGFPYEIVLLENPYEKNVGDWIKVKVLLDGKPMKNKVITARNRKNGDAPTYQYSTTNQNGECSFRLERDGEWFIHSTHLFPSRDKSKSDWESYWASYSFGMK